MLKAKQRGGVWWLHGTVRGKFMRLSLKTRNHGAAATLVNKIERASAEGANSPLWLELSASLPSSAFDKLAGLVGYVSHPTEKVPTWEQLRHAYSVYAAGLVARKKLRQSTLTRYEYALKAFSTFLQSTNIEQLPEITRSVVDHYKTWRLERILEKKHSKGGAGIDLDVAILHRVFSFAVEHEMVERNPVKMEGKPGANPERGAQPFSEAELRQLRDHADEDLLAFLLLRWTGLRAGDAVDLRWAEVNLKEKKISRITEKNSKQVTIPIHPELLFALQAERDRRNPSQQETVLLNPATGKPLRRPGMYVRMKALGKRAGVVHVHPHRYRDTFACDLLLKGASVYYVAKLLGDTAQTIETHYAPFVQEHIERARGFIEADGGLEPDRTKIAHPPTPGRTPN